MLKPYLLIQNWRWCHNFPRKVSVDFSQIRGSRIRERRKKKMNLCFSESWPSLKANSVVVSSYFLFWGRVINTWMLTFWGDCDVTSSFGSSGMHYWQINCDALQFSRCSSWTFISFIWSWGTKKVLLSKHGGSRGCICCAILVMFSIFVALERIQLRLYLIFTGIKTAPF